MACFRKVLDTCQRVEEELDYGVDLTRELSNVDDTISLSEWTCSSPDITIYNTSNAATKTIGWISGGSVGRTYQIINKVTTSNPTPRVYILTINLEIN